MERAHTTALVTTLIGAHSGDQQVQGVRGLPHGRGPLVQRAFPVGVGLREVPVRRAGGFLQQVGAQRPQLGLRR
eukprot:725431-Pyramimonas_sp.AAC.1